MASPPQPTSISATEQRPSPQYRSTAASGLSPPTPSSMLGVPGLAQLAQFDESDFISQHLPTHTAPRRRRGQVSEREIETYQRWRLDISTRI